MPSVGDFRVPSGPDTGRLKAIIPNKDVSIALISPYLLEGEHFVWDGPYNTKEFPLATRPGQSMGRLFVTNHRLLFWSDDSSKPHAGLFYEDIQGWKTSWMPMKSRGVIVIVNGRKTIFAANSTAVQNAERYVNK